MEYILLEDQGRSVRFERASASPIWLFDYRTAERTEVYRDDGLLRDIVTPDVRLPRYHWQLTVSGVLRAELRPLTTAPFDDYLMAIWGLPKEFATATHRVVSSAETVHVVWNLDGEYHLVLGFDLYEGCVITVECVPRAATDEMLAANL
jgi:hypothetical protein